ncbi:MAG: hypothetical protein SAL07_10785 [Oscillatoria sp. PMC 1051.18]|nr:hypothetical protein [Oscillatoria sp. PMC 1050.18]MEC5030390.1 hypothetical protein [Oscillatoria sp. PMC 1051.18]
MFNKLKIICGSLVAVLPAIPLAATALPVAPQNNQPLNPPLSEQREYDPEVYRLRPSVMPPLPESRQAPDALISPRGGKVNVTLRNPSNAPMLYQAVGDTDARVLPPYSEVTLLDLGAPQTITVTRPEGKLIMARAEEDAEGMLSVTLEPTNNFDLDSNTVRISREGAVYLY